MVKEYEITDSDDLYDCDILTDRKCPKCGGRIISHPDCGESCSDENCNYVKK